MIAHRTKCLILFALAFAGCGKEQERDKPSRPDWRGGSIDGIAPLMTPRDVNAALERHHYRQVPCAVAGKVLADPLNRGDESACFRAPAKRMTVSLYFRGEGETRRLAVATFREPWASDATDAERLKHSRYVERVLLDRLGPPMQSVDGTGYRTLYWRRPGGNPDLPDMIAMSVGAVFGANVTLTSMWAYGEHPPGS